MKEGVLVHIHTNILLWVQEDQEKNRKPIKEGREAALLCIPVRLGVAAQRAFSGISS